MELRQLRHLLTVGESGSITAAARKLRLTQPALSRQIKALETEPGTALLERGAHSVALTPAGEVLVSEGRSCLEMIAFIEELKQAAKESGDHGGRDLPASAQLDQRTTVLPGTGHG